MNFIAIQKNLEIAIGALERVIVMLATLESTAGCAHLRITAWDTDATPSKRALARCLCRVVVQESAIIRLASVNVIHDKLLQIVRFSNAVVSILYAPNAQTLAARNV